MIKKMMLKDVFRFCIFVSIFMLTSSRAFDKGTQINNQGHICMTDQNSGPGLHSGTAISGNMELEIIDLPEVTGEDPACKK